MLVYKNNNTGEIMHGDQITLKSMRPIARLVRGSYHVERHGDVELPWIEKHYADRTVEAAHEGDYFLCRPGSDDFRFLSASEFELLYTEVYDPEIDGREDVYFDPEVDTHR